MTDENEDTIPGQSGYRHHEEIELQAPWERGRVQHWLFDAPTRITGWKAEHTEGCRVCRILLGNIIVCEDEAIDDHLIERMTSKVLQPGVRLQVELFTTIGSVTFAQLKPLGVQLIRTDCLATSDYRPDGERDLCQHRRNHEGPHSWEPEPEAEPELVPNSGGEPPEPP